jgi:hypothetical protein
MGTAGHERAASARGHITTYEVLAKQTDTAHHKWERPKRATVVGRGNVKRGDERHGREHGRIERARAVSRPF